MPAAIKRRKVSIIKSVSAINKPINAFTRVSKPSSVTETVIDKNNLVESLATTPIKCSTGGRKRKLGLEGEGAVDQISVILPMTMEEREIKPLPQRRANDHFQTSPEHANCAISQASTETPTKGARILLDRLHFSSNTLPRPPLNAPSTNPKLHSPIPDLPCELLALIYLHAAFLTALSLHYAHNGTQSPADLRLLCPNVARAWGKRQVILEDIRRTLGVMNTSIPEGSKDYRISILGLSDYGHGKICVEIKTTVRKGFRLARPVNENILNDIFVRGLKKAWQERAVDMEVKEFIESLPLESIASCSSLAKMSPLLAKGQRRLEDMRAGIIARKELAAAATVKEKPIASGKSNTSKPNLLERLRAKQLEQAGKAPPPNKAEINRKQALERIDEVVSVLGILSTSTSVGQTRISFTLPTVLGKLQDSFKTPISKDEADICVRLLASEIAPQWVRIVKMGKVEALAVNREERPTDLDIEGRIKLASERI